MNSAFISRRLFVRGAAFSSLSLALALAGCKPAADTTTTNSTAPTGNTTSTTDTNAPTGETIAIGHFGSLSGGTATFGKSTDNGIRMAFEEINAKGGLLGKKLELFTEDDASRTEQVPGVVQKLINQNNVLCLMGEVASSRSLAAAPIAQADKVPMISPSSTNPKVTQVGDYIFRTCFIDPFQGTVMSKFARETLKAKKAAILTDVANDYSKGLTEFFTNDWKKGGGQIVATESYSEGDKDFQSQLTKIKGSNPDVIYIPGYYTEVGNIAVQARRLGLKQPMMGGDGWDSPKLFQIGGQAVQGCYFSNHYSSQSKDPKVVKFVTAYKAKYGEVPDALGAVAYDAAYIVADAIKRAGSEDRSKLRDALASTKNYAGVTGTISIDADRNAIKPAVVLEVEGNEAKYVATVNP
ncbi:leucine-specific-binding protein [Abditibacteriota bacterium]|nr:leucine-specific-binding protein [Abditibacteriota bacterium]